MCISYTRLFHPARWKHWKFSAGQKAGAGMQCGTPAPAISLLQLFPQPRQRRQLAAALQPDLLKTAKRPPL